MSVVSWGKPRCLAKKLGGSGTWFEVPTPVQNTTTLATTKGEKKEAKIEGGENEDVKYERNTYACALTVRATKGRKKPFPDVDGLVDGNYVFVLIPEDATNQGFAFYKSVVSLEDGFTAEDGGTWAYTIDALKDGDKPQIQWGVISVTETGGAISKVEITPDGGPKTELGGAS